MMYQKAISIAVGVLIAFGTVTAAVAAQNARDAGLPGESRMESQIAPDTEVSPQIPNVPVYQSPYAQAIGEFAQNGVPQRAKNISSITHPTTGVYCITVVNYTTLNTDPIVTVEWGKSWGVALFAQFNDTRNNCGGSGAPANVWEVRTYKADTAGPGSALQTPVLSNQVAFLFVLP